MLQPRAQHLAKASFNSDYYILDGCLAYAGRYLCVSSSQPSIRVYDARQSTFLFELKDHSTNITDIVSVTGHPELLFSSQSDTGVMVTDLRVAKPVQFLAELTGQGKVNGSISVSDDGTSLAIGADGDLHLVDARTWCSTRCIAQLHNDEITRVRHCSDAVVCTAGEDQLINFVDVRLEEDDMMLNIINGEEVITKMHHYPEHGCVAMVGSCENVFIGTVNGSRELKYPRRDYATYQVDVVPFGDQLCLLSGAKDDEGNAAGLDFTVLRPAVRHLCSFPQGIHTEQVRFTLSFDDTVITGGEDGMIAYWRLEWVQPQVAAEVTSDSSSMKARSKPRVGPQPYSKGA
jgi:WD40 repeat protein